MTLNKARTLLYVAEDESDTVDVIDLNPQDKGSPSQNQPATVNTVDRNHTGHRSSGRFSVFFADAIYRREYQQRDALAGREVSLRDQWQSE
jgi:hypothetical protein